MSHNPIAAQNPTQYGALRGRLILARDSLDAVGQRLQAIARAYYAVYALACHLAGKFGVLATHARAGERVTDCDFSHVEIPDVVYALYTGNKRGNVTDPGSSPGIGSGIYSDQEAYRNLNTLMQIRIEADYGPSVVHEPYDAAQTGRWLEMSKGLMRDLETLK